MNAVSNSFQGTAAHSAAPAGAGDEQTDNHADNQASAFAAEWAAVEDAARAVSFMAGLAPEPASDQPRAFPDLIHEAGGWRLDEAAQRLADLAAILTPGVAALLGVLERGQNARVPALVLWREYHASRSALLALAK
ncbi:hypothetical protein HME9302_02446 [Alteripontixanthobacter maritimus]|uniref:Uncharacterized protein n=1 Tax=Alteripontixanthobacter maritimus TaxID=2161824 RepID=A0A369QDA8_9SPHN|nr:hypothetical protein [Alteripontixanthobacter maritimus]RDC61227.1 hypothetical protein HME9302_02446 [Alteripontixanthobacter maritimus]